MCRTLFRIALAAVGLFTLAFIWQSNWPRIRRGVNDFAQLYAGTHLLGTGDLYNAERMYEWHRRTTGRTLQAVLYSRPPFYAVLLWPLGRLPYLEAYALWQTLSLAAVVAFILLWPAPRWITVLICCWYMPLANNFASGQDVTFVLLYLVLSMLLLRQGRHFAAGLLLSLCAAKFHLFVLVPVCILAHRLWRLAAGLALGAAALLAVSFAAEGPSWPLRYLGVLSDPSIHPTPTSMPNLHGLFPDSVLLQVAASMAVVAASWLAMRRLSPDQALMLAPIGGLLLSYHAYSHDSVLLLPALVLVFWRGRSLPLKVVAAAWIMPLTPLLLQLPRYHLIPKLLLLALLAGMVQEILSSGGRPFILAESNP